MCVSYLVVVDDGFVLVWIWNFVGVVVDLEEVDVGVL